MSGGLLVRGGTVVSPRGRRQLDVRCRAGKVAELGEALEPKGEEIIDATGALVLPGVVDPHVHFALEAPPHRTADDFATGSASALAGGVTTIIDFAHQPAGTSFEAAIDARLAEAAPSRVDYALHLNPTDLSGGQLAELERLTERGVTSAKVYTTYRAAGFFCDDDSIVRFMRAAADVGWVVMVHCENDAIIEGTRAAFLAAGKRGFEFHAASRPAIAEVEAVGRVLAFAEETSCPVYPVHLSAGRSARLIADARRRGVAALGETCPHFLVADESVYADPDRAARFIHTPPLRTESDRAILWEELASGGGLQAVGSDHCGYTLAQRTDYGDLTKVAPGIPGTETLLALLYTVGVAGGRMTAERMVAVCSENPARSFGLYPQKGVISVGSDADLVVYQPEGERNLRDDELHSAAGYSPYAGMTIRGRVAATIVRGTLGFDGERILAPEGSGRFVASRPVAPTDLP
ncbi:MAG TPA: dihydropyrimidinase [Candidatus Binatia bacterium]|nr:dihydropyrimidinase [Candidatus Binatia bacterium]